MPDTSVIDKINKLLALANSPNEHEAALAAQKASLLLTQYNLSLADLGNDDLTEVAELAIEKTSRLITWKMILLSGIAEANGCKALRNDWNGNMELIGNSTSLIICQNLYEYLSTTIWRLAKERKGNGRAYLNGFRVGCATRLSERLIAQRREMEKSGIPGQGETPANSAIVVRSMFEKSASAIREYLKQQGMTVKTRSTSLGSSESGFYSGYEVGDRISLHEHVQASDSVKKLGDDRPPT